MTAPVHSKAALLPAATAAGETDRSLQSVSPAANPALVAFPMPHVAGSNPAERAIPHRFIDAWTTRRECRW